MMQIISDFLKDFQENAKSIKKNGLKKQIPNILTFSRALAPIIIIPTLLSNKLNIAIIELIFFALTDLLDGKLARKFNCVSQFGVKLDAICDKIFELGIFIPAMIKYPILVINLLLEIAISYINLLSEAKRNHPISNYVGKVKTTLLSITLVLAYIPNISKYFIWGAAFITLMLQIVAFIKYREIDIIKDKMKRKKSSN